MPRNPISQRTTRAAAVNAVDAANANAVAIDKLVEVVKLHGAVLREYKAQQDTLNARGPLGRIKFLLTGK